MGGEASAARQLAGLLRRGGQGLVAQRVARLVAEACAGSSPAEAARLCGGLRDSVLELAAGGKLTLPDARRISREIDSALSAAMEAVSPPGRALGALESALGAE